MLPLPRKLIILAMKYSLNLISNKSLVKDYQQFSSRFSCTKHKRFKRDWQQLRRDCRAVTNSCAIGRFHTRGRTNRLRRTNRLMCKRDEHILDEQVVWYLSVWKDDFSQTICPSRRTSRRQYDINLHQTVNCETICPSWRFVCPLVWKRLIQCNQNGGQTAKSSRQWENNIIPVPFFEADT